MRYKVMCLFSDSIYSGYINCNDEVSKEFEVICPLADLCSDRSRIADEIKDVIRTAVEALEDARRLHDNERMNE